MTYDDRHPAQTDSAAVASVATVEDVRRFLGTEACPNAFDCPIAHVFEDPNHSVYAEIFCYGDYAGCARFRRMERGEAVPESLLPHGKRHRPAR